ncbi:hypothetical protein Tco_0480299 [Tanacetum coccineum]
MKLTTSQLIDDLSCGGIDMVIKDLDLEPKINAIMRDFLEVLKSSWWKELSKETSSKILPCWRWILLGRHSSPVAKLESEWENLNNKRRRVLYPFETSRNALKVQYKKSSTPTDSYRHDAFHKRDHDDHLDDDSLPKGENSAKIKKISRGSKSIKGSSSKQPANESNTTSSNNTTYNKNLMRGVEDSISR